MGGWVPTSDPVFISGSDALDNYMPCDAAYYGKPYAFLVQYGYRGIISHISCHSDRYLHGYLEGSAKFQYTLFVLEPQHPNLDRNNTVCCGDRFRIRLHAHPSYYVVSADPRNPTGPLVITDDASRVFSKPGAVFGMYDRRRPYDCGPYSYEGEYEMFITDGGAKLVFLEREPDSCDPFCITLGSTTSERGRRTLTNVQLYERDQE